MISHPKILTSLFFPFPPTYLCPSRLRDLAREADGSAADCRRWRRRFRFVPLASLYSNRFIEVTCKKKGPQLDHIKKDTHSEQELSQNYLSDQKKKLGGLSANSRTNITWPYSRKPHWPQELSAAKSDAGFLLCFQCFVGQLDVLTYVKRKADGNFAGRFSDERKTDAFRALHFQMYTTLYHTVAGRAFFNISKG